MYLKSSRLCTETSQCVKKFAKIPFTTDIRQLSIDSHAYNATVALCFILTDVLTTGVTV